MKCIHRVQKADVGREMSTCGARFQPQGESSRDDLLAVMLALEAKKALFLRTLQGWGKRRQQGQDE